MNKKFMNDFLKQEEDSYFLAPTFEDKVNNYLKSIKK